jgi:hypothetical protein
LKLKRKKPGEVNGVNAELKELTLLLLYLNSWEEKVIPGVTVNRSWKTFRFEILDELEAEGLIHGGKKAKSVGITEEGMKAAEKLKGKYLIGREK